MCRIIKGLNYGESKEKRRCNIYVLRNCSCGCSGGGVLFAVLLQNLFSRMDTVDWNHRFYDYVSSVAEAYYGECFKAV